MQQAAPTRRTEVAELYSKYGATVRNRCRYLLRDEEASRDAVQEVFVKVMRSIGEFRNESSPLTWILRIATNYCLNLIAANKAKWHDRFKQYVRHQEAEQSMRPSALERSWMVRDLLEQLDVETQQVAVHYYVDEMTQEEIAEALHRSLPTIRKRLEKFRRVASKELGHESV
jgi:RNA polymerase sigma-70 factor (ECF subfamily)